MNELTYANPPDKCQSCGGDFNKVMFDGKVNRLGRQVWANVCRACWLQYGVGRLGLGFGQKFQLRKDGKWVKVAG